ncbi:MAG TPA: response regulator transcription factor [Actinomycetota bacterium]|nr:response regulator transcription factor [Actinomycetota bacterium]
MTSVVTSRETASGRARPRVVATPVILVDPLPVVRAGLAMLIDARPEFTVVAQAGSADDALAAMERAPLGTVAIVGLGLEGPRDAFWLIEAIRERSPGTTVIATGARSDAVTISRALFCGASGFVDKNVDPAEFLESVRLAVAGEMVLAGPPSEWVGAIAGGLERDRSAEAWLTLREREVLSIAAEGLTAREIADRLGVRERTVTTHLSRIYGKLGVRTRIAAIRTATAAGLVPNASE